MIDEHQNFYWPSKTLLEKDAWAASGELTAVSVVLEKRPINISTGIDPDREAPDTVVGRRVYTALPPKGTKAWPERMWSGLRNGKIDAAAVVGLQMTDENSPENPDESVYVTVERDGRSKKFELGTDGIPSVRLSLTEDHEPALGLDDFHREVDANVRDFYKDVGFSWNNKWATASTAQEWLKYRN